MKRAKKFFYVDADRRVTTKKPEQFIYIDVDLKTGTIAPRRATKRA